FIISSIFPWQPSAARHSPAVPLGRCGHSPYVVRMSHVPAALPLDDEIAPVPRRVVRAWALWDFGQQAFNTVILTFVFSVYITAAVAADRDHGAAVLATWQAWGGLALALLAPAL